MSEDQKSQDILIVTGMSGAGRSTVANTLEDMGWYVVDNLPLRLLITVADMAERTDGAVSQIAAVIDARGANIASDVRETIAELNGKARVRTLFLDAADDVLVSRYDAVRRPHPLMGDGSLVDGIRAERKRLRQLRDIFDFVVDTSRYNVHELSSKIRELFAAHDAPRLQILVQSFGFKYSVPSDADIMIDMRFLPNPFWVPQLRPLTGVDKEVSDYVLSQPGAQEFLNSFFAALQQVFAGYQRENKRHALLAVGCTGGKHRSVATALFLAEKIAQIPGVQVTVKHRDLGRE